MGVKKIYVESFSFFPLKSNLKNYKKGKRNTCAYLTPSVPGKYDLEKYDTEEGSRLVSLKINFFKK